MKTVNRYYRILPVLESLPDFEFEIQAFDYIKLETKKEIDSNLKREGFEWLIDSDEIDYNNYYVEKKTDDLSMIPWNEEHSLDFEYMNNDEEDIDNFTVLDVHKFDGGELYFSVNGRYCKYEDIEIEKIKVIENVKKSLIEFYNDTDEIATFREVIKEALQTSDKREKQYVASLLDAIKKEKPATK